MTYAVNHKTFAAWFGRKAFTMNNAVASEGGILPRILDTIFESHERQADREISPFVAQSGGAFTDGIEREIMQRASNGRTAKADMDSGAIAATF
jgi:hypothetical protein